MSTIKCVIRPPFWREAVQTDLFGESMTHQSHAESCDINRIVGQFTRTGQLPPNPRGQQPLYADVTGLQGDPTELRERARETLDQARNFAADYKPTASDPEVKSDPSSPPPPSGEPPVGEAKGA